MVREIGVEELNKLEPLIERYVNHMSDNGVTSETVKEQMKSGISGERTVVLIEENSEGDFQGFLVINLKSDRIPIIFANWKFPIEKQLLDNAFEKLSQNNEQVSFESGYPTPWLTEELSSHAIELGFVRHERAYMQLHPIDKEIFSMYSIEDKFEFIPFERSMVQEVSKLVFECVDGTIDQDLFPYVYGSIPRIEEFLNKFLDGAYGKHERFYSWVLRENGQNIGACFCFLMENEETAFLMHIVIHPDYRQHGLGRAILCHSFNNLLRLSPTVTKIELAVTLSNPAKQLYDSLGFRTLNDASTFVWKR